MVRRSAITSRIPSQGKTVNAEHAELMHGKNTEGEITAGPWLKTESNTVYTLHERSGLGGRVVKCNRMWLHVYFDRDVPEAEQQATVDAIAQVPEMLAAIKANAVR